MEYFLPPDNAAQISSIGALMLSSLPEELTAESTPTARNDAKKHTQTAATIYFIIKALA